MVAHRRTLTFLFAATLFISAALLFWVEPMVAKMLLPLLGGTPAVWNTCLLFFQTVLLAGYAYALFASRRLTLRQQIVAQVLLLAVATVSFPVWVSPATAANVPREGNPALWLLGRLFLVVGLPFFVLSTLSPLLQRWFTATRHESARDPYFLYAASNAGSLFALVGYPLAIEPLLALRRQSWLWAASYGALALLVALCGAVALVANSRAARAAIGGEEAERHEPQPIDEGALTKRRRAMWVLLAFVPSSLMLGVTTYVSTDIASLPLLWVVPLSLYLLTLIVAFARRRIVRRRWVEFVMPGVTLVFLLAYLSGATQPTWFLVLLHLLFFFVAALMCHGRLADDRPATRHLAEFYLWMSVGGALGGLFNALVAPVVFKHIVEYPLAVLIACALIPRRAPDEARDPQRERWLDLGYAAALGVLAIAFALVVARVGWWTTESLALVVGVPLILAYLLRRRPVRFALALGAVMLGSAFYRSLDTRALLTERNFFGTLRVTQDAGSDVHWLYHGTTIHGRQSTQLSKQCEPLSYYHRTGPLASVFAAFDSRPGSPEVAVVGLGTGATAAYARAGQRWTFYEINPAVVRVAETPDYFTYLSYCASAMPVQIVLGDARLRLADAHANAYGLIVLDAFSSDAIPLHLMTLEALDLYLSKLAPGGVVLFHVSNRSLDLHPVVADLALSRGLAALSSDDDIRNPDKEPSHWVAVARAAEDLAPLAGDAQWKPLAGDPARRVWTDDYSNIVGIFKWY
ncbi:MAG: fused MFS/spermidine synthase [Acidobacteria bacterium]|nr:fused MFS/spermidine synthase [Acidobacteriota bacterium]MCA1641671.1 fused MFS/spermidine synthase [Acidobacteriota bacterium]